MAAVLEEASSSSSSSSNPKRLRRSDQPGPSMSAAFPDDVLLEIFTRLPHSKAAVHCSAVCKAWLRLISSAEFATRFHNNRPYSDPSFAQPYTTLVKFERSNDGLIQSDLRREHDCLDAAHDVLHTSRGSRPLFDLPPFIPWDPRLSSVRAATGDLLLVTHRTGFACFELLLCNPITKQRFLLPPGPIDASVLGANDLASPFGLAHRPGNNAYRVVFAHPYGNFSERRFLARILNTETGTWTWSIFATPKASFSDRYNVCSDDAVAGASGVLYFLLRRTVDKFRHGAITGIVSIDPFKVDGRGQNHSCRMILMPPCFGRPTKRDVRLAVVRGRLRMALSTYGNPDGCGGGLDVMVCELRYSNDDERDDDAFTTWNIAHRFSIAEEVFVVGMHPNDGDVIFVLVRGTNELCTYHIGRREYHKIGEIPDMYQKHVKDHLPMYLNVYTLLHTSPPSWPAPPLPSMSTTTT